MEGRTQNKKNKTDNIQRLPIEYRICRIIRILRRFNVFECGLRAAGAYAVYLRIRLMTHCCGNSFHFYSRIMSVLTVEPFSFCHALCYCSVGMLLLVHYAFIQPHPLTQCVRSAAFFVVSVLFYFTRACVRLASMRTQKGYTGKKASRTNRNGNENSARV